MEKQCIGVDIGGTSIKIGSFSENGNLLKKWFIDTKQGSESNQIIPEIAAAIKEYAQDNNIALSEFIGIGLTVPGPVLADGYVEACVNISGWRNIYPGRELSKLLDGVTVSLLNDANAAALGETWQGAAKGCKSMFLMTLGTGVGGGLIYDGKILNGFHGLAGEIGHISFCEDEIDTCNCGAIGCIDQEISATGIVRETKRLLSTKGIMGSNLSLEKNFTCEDVFENAKLGDPVAKLVIDHFGKYLGKALTCITLMVDPEIILLGGGISQAGDFLLQIAKSNYEKWERLSVNRAKIMLASLGNDAGIFGAAKFSIQ